MASRRRGQPSNHQLAQALKESVLELVRARYADFGPTLALEKLVECHGLVVSKETLRKWMTEDGLWVPHARRRDRVHQPRHRRSCTGELIQIDGCDHEWFEARSERCTLLVYIDDATSKLMGLYFCDAESTFNYFDGTVQIRHDGKVLAMTSFAKEEVQITQGAIASNKLLSGVLQQVKDKQATKDSENLAKAKTKRDKRLPLQRIKATG